MTVSRFGVMHFRAVVQVSLDDVRMVQGTEEPDLAEGGLGETLIVVAARDADL